MVEVVLIKSFVELISIVYEQFAEPNNVYCSVKC